ncbi:ATP-binding protein [Aliifodinibius salipaludis]|uniref:ATP-binding protein n=1 Tax=Fodinibius salipaludis TaxID=2032627 RepID=A0A2A2G950_9BACT|nr:ATP-binding protein [Aliifodinibius salipaludis]PAU93375.1 ATP-binding protein [Aliifodinibius salipaludis]
MSKPDTKKLVLNSSFDEMEERLGPYVEKLKQWTGVTEEDSSRIMLTLSEAVNNAIIHGNNENPDKKVVVLSTLDKENRVLTISVEDQGEGFDPEEIPDPLKEENLLNEGGRGVYLIKQYADDLQFSKGGSKATITFELGS